MFNTFNCMAINRCCILGGPYYPTLPPTLYLSPLEKPNLKHKQLGDDLFLNSREIHLKLSFTFHGIIISTRNIRIKLAIS